MPDYKSERNQLEAIQKLFVQKNYSEALLQTEKMLQEFPLSFQGKLFMARIQRAIGRLAESRQMLGDLDKQYPYNIGVLTELAAVLMSKNELQESLSIYNRILFLDSFNAEAKHQVEEIQRMLEKGFASELEETQVDKKIPQEEGEQGGDKPRQESLPQPESAAAATTVPLAAPLAHKPAQPMPEFDLHLGDTGEFAPVNPPPEADEKPGDKTTPMRREEGEAPVMTLHLGDTADFPAKSFPAEEPSDMPADAAIKDDHAEADMVIIEPDPIGGPPPGPEKPPAATIPTSLSEAAADRDLVFVEPELEAKADARQPAFNEKPDAEEIPFPTDSAAELYARQGMIREATAIYTRLYEQTGDDRYLKKLADLKKMPALDPVRARMITALERFLKQLQSRESDHVQ